MNNSKYNPRISTNTCVLQKGRSIDEVLNLIKASGFDTYDFTMAKVDDFFTSDNYVENAKRLREYADKIGLICNQTHSLFPVYHSSFSEEEIKLRIEYTKRIIEITSILGSKICVVHPINDYNEEQNYAYFQNFLPVAKKFNVLIAIENMWNWKGDKASLAACSSHNNFKKLLDMLNDNHFIACVDIGHAELLGLETSSKQMIKTLGNYVKCLHIHDNDLRRDYHMLPFTGLISFDSVLDALADIDYRGDITFECDGFFDKMPKELHLSSLKLLHEIGEYLKTKLLDRYKQ